MFLAHYGMALAAKRLSPKESLGATVMAAQWVDLLWPILLLLGLEQVRIVPGLMKANSLDFVSYPISHSLLLVLLWGLAGASLYLFLKRRVRGAVVIGALIVSHWLLDFPVHRPDLPLWPGSPFELGGGLWNSLAATLSLEFGILGAGLYLYLRATRPKDRAGRWGLWSMVGLLVLFYLSSFSGPPPSESVLAVGGLFLWLFVPWAHWVDRHRMNAASTEPDRP